MVKERTYQKRKDRVSCKALINGTEARVHCKLFVCSKQTPNQIKLWFLIKFTVRGLRGKIKTESSKSAFYLRNHNSMEEQMTSVSNEGSFSRESDEI